MCTVLPCDAKIAVKARIASSHLSFACCIRSFLLQVPQFLLYQQVRYYVNNLLALVISNEKAQVQLPYCIAEIQLCQILVIPVFLSSQEGLRQWFQVWQFLV